MREETPVGRRARSWSLGRRSFAASVCAVVAGASLYGALLLAETRRNELLFANAEEVQYVVEEYARQHGRFPSFSEYDADLKYVRVPINPYTERRARVFRADDGGNTLIPKKSRAGHLGYFLRSSSSCTIFVFGGNGNVLGTLCGQLPQLAD